MYKKISGWSVYVCSHAGTLCSKYMMVQVKFAKIKTKCISILKKDEYFFEDNETEMQIGE